MDIKQLRFLVALADTRHFGQAATRCHVTQPTLSARLRNLEEELGLELVSRDQRFEGFTEAGQRILAWARSVLAACDGLQAEAEACRGQLLGTLRLGLVPLPSLDPQRLLHCLSQAHPGLRFALHTLSAAQILEGLADNRLDLGLSYVEGIDLEHFAVLPLATTEVGLLHHAGYFQFDEAVLDWEALHALPLGLLGTDMHFRRMIDHAFLSRRLQPAPLLESDAVQPLIQAVRDGLCCAPVPLHAGLERSDAELRLHPLQPLPGLAPMGLLMRRDAPRSALAEVCWSTLATAFDSTHPASTPP